MQEARMKQPAMVVPGAMDAMIQLSKAAHNAAEGSALPPLELIYLRASQINGCSFCVDMHSRDAKKAGESDERIWSVAAWREAPYFTAAECAALALTECVTRIADRPDPVPDGVWAEAAKYFNEHELGTLVLAIAAINVWNRFNVATRQPAQPQ